MGALGCIQTEHLENINMKRMLLRDLYIDRIHMETALICFFMHVSASWTTFHTTKPNSAIPNRDTPF